MPARNFIGQVLGLTLLGSTLAFGQPQQTQSGEPAAGPPPAEKREEPVAADSPRASMTRFFELTRKRNYEQAAAYLQLEEAQRERAAELTRRLSAVLERHLFIEPEKLALNS